MPDMVADHIQRQQAIRPQHSFIVKAPAGSGKTGLLIQRYLKLLSLVDAPEEIIAITFTRKAAAEMQGRILDAITMASEARCPEQEHQKQIHDLGRAVLERDRECNWQILENPGRMRIQTIDSLCATLTRQMPVLSGLGAQPDTVEDASELYLEAASRTLDELEGSGAWSDAIATLLMHLDNDLPKIRNMVAMMLARRDQWLHHISIKRRRKELESAIVHIIESALEAAIKAFPEILADELLACLRYAAANLEKEDRDSRIRHCLDIKSIPGHSTADLPCWRGIVELLFTGSNEWRKQASAGIGFPAASGNKAESEIRRSMKNRFSALLAGLSEQDALYAKLLEVRILPSQTYTEDEWRVVNALCQLLVLAEAQLRILFAERNQIDFSGVEQAASQALGNQDDPSDLAMYLDYQIKHILVDEFQDVSSNQYKFLQQLTEGWAPGDGHTLFLVGDPMQSIYRFREAQVGLFLDIWQQERLGQVALTPLTLKVNFRSYPGIVEWVNDSFRQVLPVVTDSSRGAVVYESAESFHDVESVHAVTFHPLLYQDDQGEAERVLDIINQIRGQDPKSRIAILVRARTHLHEIVLLLKKAGLRFRAIDIEPLGTRPAVQDLLALTRALTHLADRIAWLAILRAPWCGLMLSDLSVLAGGAKDKTIWELLHDEKRIGAVSEDGRKRLYKLREILNQALAEQRRRSLRRQVESVWLQLGGAATLQNETELEDVYTFLELLEQFDKGGDLVDRERFMEEAVTLYAAADVEADETLQIMTIHKAKGLEFDTVILPGLARGGRVDETRLLLWTENSHGGYQDLLLAPVKGTGENASPVYDYIKWLDKEKQAYEEGRLLYVAATRAKRNLHLLAKIRMKEGENGPELAPPQSNTLLSQLWPVVRKNCEQARQGSTPARLGMESEKMVVTDYHRRLVSGWVMPEPPRPLQWLEGRYGDALTKVPSVIEFEWAGESIRHIGSVVHCCIQAIAEEGIDTWDEKRIRSIKQYHTRLLQQKGVPGEELQWATRQVQEALCRMIKDARGQWILARHSEQHNEYPVSGIYDGKVINIVIDRTFVDENGVRWIVDYKTSRHEGPDLDAFLEQEKGRYRDQLEKYATLFRCLDTRPIRLGLYFPLLQGWCEWAFDY